MSWSVTWGSGEGAVGGFLLVCQHVSHRLGAPGVGVEVDGLED